MSSDINVQTFSGKVNINNNLLVGSSHFYVDTVGNKVGITTASPDAGLHVNSNAYVNTDFRVGTSIVMNDTAGQITAGSFVGDGSAMTGINSDSGSWVNGTGNVYLSTTTDKVGIGTTSPLTPLHISSANEITTSPAGSAVSQMRYGSTNSTVLFGVSSTAGHISVYDTSNFSTHRDLCFNADGGNVGVGKTAPLIDFDVGGNGENTRIGRSTTGSMHGADKRNQMRIGRFDEYEGIGDQGFLGMRLMVDTATNLNLSGEADNQTAIQFYTWGNNIANSREVMRINSRGDVGIGTTSPSAELHVNGVIKQTGASWALTNHAVNEGVNGGGSYQSDYAYFNRGLSSRPNVTLTNHNQKGYNTRSRITVNVAGKYAVYINGFRQTGTSGTKNLNLYKNGAYVHVRAYSGPEGTSNYATVGSSYTIMDLNANDYLEVYISHGIFHGNDSIYFVGHLIA